MGKSVSNGCSSGLLGLLLLHLLKVKLKFLTLEDVSIATAGLSWTRGDASEKSTRGELVRDFLVDDSVLGSSLEGGSDVLGDFSLFSGLGGLLDLLLVELHVVVLKVPLAEGVRINHHNAILNNSFRSHKLVICSVVYNIKNSGLSGDRLGSPGEHSFLDLEGAPLEVATAGSDWSDSGCAESGHGSLSAHLELSLLLVNGHATSRSSSLVP